MLREGQGLRDLAHFEVEGLAKDLRELGQSGRLGRRLVAERLAELGGTAQALGGGREVAAVGALPDLFEALLGPGVEPAVGDLPGQLGLQVLEFLLAAPLELDEVDAELSAHGLADLAGLQGRRRVGEGLDHL